MDIASHHRKNSVALVLESTFDNYCCFYYVTIGVEVAVDVTKTH